ncbi:hypothetical protein ACWFMI_08040 [Nocardiopsis terrae]
MHRDHPSGEHGPAEPEEDRSRDLPPGFVEFTRRLAQDRSRSREDGPGCFGAVLAGLLGVPFTFLLLMLAVPLVERLSLEVLPTQVTEAEVVMVDGGTPVVSLRPGPESLRAQEDLVWAQGEYRPGDPTRVEVSYRVDAPEKAMISGYGYGWPWWASLLLVPPALLLVFGLWHRLGTRASWFWRRARTLVKGPERGGAGLRRQVAVRAVPGVLLLLVAVAALVAGVFVTEELILLAAPPLAFGPLLLLAALYRQADLAPVTVPPSPFRLLPGYSGRITALVVLAAVILAMFSLDRAQSEFTVPEERVVRGEAEILGQECSKQRDSSCRGYLVVLFEYDGMVYRDRVEAELLGMDALVEAGSVEVEWDAADPTEVRLAR